MALFDFRRPMAPDKYSHIDFKPNAGMREEAQRGLDWRREFNRGGTEVGVARARDITDGDNMSPDTVKRMFSYFSRHEVDKQGQGFERGEEGYPSAGRIAWALWGGDAGFAWARQRVNQMDSADEKSIKMTPAKYTAELARLKDTERDVWEKMYADTFAQTGDDTKAYLAAWGAVNKMPYGVKSIAGKGAVVGGWGMLFTDPDNLDLEGEYFDSATETLLDYYTTAPLWYEHGKDYHYGGKPIGKRVSAQVYPRGIWVEHELDETHPHYEKTLQEVRAGELAYSSDAVGHYVETDSKGRLDNWYAAGWSLTRNPAEPALGAVTTAEFKSFITRAKSQGTTTQVSAGEPAPVSVGAVDSNVNTKPLTTGDIKMLNESDIAALQTQMDEQLNGIIASTFEQLRSMNSEDSGDDDDEATRMSDDDEKEMKEAMEAEAKSIIATDAVKQAADYKTAYAIAVKAIVSAGLNEYKQRTDERLAQKEATDDAIKSAMIEVAHSDRKSITAPVPKQNNPKPAKSTRFSAPGVMSEATKYPMASMVRSWAEKGREAAAKDFSYGTGRNGGLVMSVSQSEEIIPKLQEQLIFEELGVNMRNIDTYEYQTFKQTSNLEAYWVGEKTNIPNTSYDMDVITSITKPLAVHIPIPNMMLYHSAVNLEQEIRRQVDMRMRRAIEYAGLFGQNSAVGSNTGASPLGLLYSDGVTKTALNRAPVLNDLSAMELRLSEANIDESESWGWAFSPRTRKTFLDLTSTTGEPLLRETMADGAYPTLRGYTYKTTTNIPNNSIATSDGQSYVFLGDWQFMEMITTKAVEFAVDPYSLQRSLQTQITAYMYVDIIVTREDAFEILTDVDD